MKLFLFVVTSFSLFFAVSSEARFATCSSGRCGSARGVAQSSCSSGTCGNLQGLQGIACSSGTCGAINGFNGGLNGQIGPFQQGQFVQPQSMGGQTFGSPQGSQGLPPVPQATGGQVAQGPTGGSQTSNPSQAIQKPSLPNVAGTQTTNGTKFTVINPEPTDVSHYGEVGGATLKNLLFSPGSALSVRVKSNEYEDGIFKTFLVDPATGTAMGELADKVTEINWNDPLEKQSLQQVKAFLLGKGIDDTLRKFLKRYWPNEALPPAQEKQPDTQVADNSKNPTSAPQSDGSRGASHEAAQSNPSGRPQAEPTRQVAQKDEPTQARSTGLTGAKKPLSSKLAAMKGDLFGKSDGGSESHGDWICTDGVCRKKTAADGLLEPAVPAKQNESSGSTSGGWKVVVHIFKKANYRNACTPCDQLADASGGIHGHDDLKWWVGGKDRFPTTDIVIQNGQQMILIDSVPGANVDGINSAIKAAREKANQKNQS